MSTLIFPNSYKANTFSYSKLLENEEYVLFLQENRKNPGYELIKKVVLPPMTFMDKEYPERS